MTSDSIPPSDPERQDGGEDAVAELPPVSGDSEAAALAAVPADDIVPPPPVFDGSTGDDVIPPPPSFDGPLAGAATPGEAGALRASRRPVSERLPVPPSSDEAVTAPEPDPVFTAPDAPVSSGYRGISVAIFAFLLLLLVGAIALGVFLATNTTLPLPGFAFGIEGAIPVSGSALS